METTVKQRIKDFCNYKKISASEFARRIGVSPTYVGSIRKSIQPDKIISIALNFPDLNISWLLTGVGEMIQASTPTLTKNNTENQEESHQVPLIPTAAFAGSIQGYTPDSALISECQRITSPIPADLAITISGQSMEPVIHDGTVVLLRRLSDRPTIAWGNIYIVDSNDGAFIKRLYPHASDPNQIMCHSVNPDYPPFSIHTDAIQGIYRIVGTIHVNTTY
jgi:phage repressor protein C with HTH and peptisase S24 domain